MTNRYARGAQPLSQPAAEGGIAYTLVRSARKTLGIEILSGGAVLVRAPNGMPEDDIRRLVHKKSAWIRRHIAMRLAEPDEPEPQEIRALCDKALRQLPEKIERYGRQMGVMPISVKVTGARTRFGSCSAKGAVCFSYRLFMYPDAAVDYVVVHELAHLIEMNHSKAFYALVESVLPDWRQRRAMLKYGVE